MEDAAEKLDILARSEQQCTRCPEIAACRLRALAGAGHPHARVLFVSLSPSPEDEAAGRPAGTDCLQYLAGMIPSLNNGGRDKAYFTSLLKCVPRSDFTPRPPSDQEKENCYPYLASEISITTPHYLVPIGAETARFVLGKLFAGAPDVTEVHSSDPLALRCYDSPAFRIVPVASPEELTARDAKTRADYAERLHKLAALMGL
jgi:DNA polymerase